MLIRKSPVISLALAGAIAVLLPGCAGQQFVASSSPVKHCDWHLTLPGISSSGMQILSATTEALFSVGTANERPKGYILLARGRPNWFDGQLVGGGGEVSGAGKRDHLWRLGNTTYTVAYDASTNTVEVPGARVWLDTANVLLLDQVGETQEAPRLVGTGCLNAFDATDPGTGMRSATPDIRAYITTR